jgi:hypothetical protein
LARSYKLIFCQFVRQKGTSRGLEMLKFRRYWTLGGKVHVARE